METDLFIVITAGWPEEDDFKTPEVPVTDGFIACADGGYIVCSKAGILPDVVIGDFDSLTEEYIQEIDRLGIERIVHPCEKGETDTLLCIRYGLARGFDRFSIIGGIGGDFGHTMANIQALSFLADMGCEAEIISGTERIVMVTGEKMSAPYAAGPPASLVLYGVPGKKFSVFSFTERCLGVSIKNAAYELDDALLTQSYPLGVSNEFTEKGKATITVKQGRLLIIIS